MLHVPLCEAPIFKVWGKSSPSAYRRISSFTCAVGLSSAPYPAQVKFPQAAHRGLRAEAVKARIRYIAVPGARRRAVKRTTDKSKISPASFMWVGMTGQSRQDGCRFVDDWRLKLIRVVQNNLHTLGHLSNFTDIGIAHHVHDKRSHEPLSTIWRKAAIGSWWLRIDTGFSSVLHNSARRRRGTKVNPHVTWLSHECLLISVDLVDANECEINHQSRGNTLRRKISDRTTLPQMTLTLTLTRDEISGPSQTAHLPWPPSSTSCLIVAVEPPSKGQ